MGKVFYSVAGEGRGHATRVKTVVEELRRHHEIVVYASHLAYEFLEKTYRDATEVEIRQIPGLQFSYSGRRVSYWNSVRDSFAYLRNLPALVRVLAQSLWKEQPDLIISDFEPALPRAAQRLGLPFISFDHQHFLTTFDLSSLPLQLRWRAQSIAFTVDLFYRGQAETIVSSFFSPPLRSHCSSVTSVGILLRRELQFVRPVDNRFLLVYLRRFAAPNVMQALRRCGRKVHIYGLGELPQDGNLRYFAVNETGFLDDLISCHALVSNAGNQLVGEALALRKPVLAIPEEGNFEQSINAHFLTWLGYGVGHDATTFSWRRLAEFLYDVEMFRAKIDPDVVVGNEKAFAAICRQLPTPVGFPVPATRVA
jgi:uncharacterized protein (TIGR00661 family)